MSDMRNIVVVPYDLHWPEMYRQEAARLSAVFGQNLIKMHHIGSTSIPGIYAKPVIDMMPLVRNIEQVETTNEAMIELGYSPKGENGIAGRRHFTKGDDAHRTHHVHSYEPDNPEVTWHLDLRDYLIAHPDEAQQYGNLKIELARQFPDDIIRYIEGKESFIKAIVAKARPWRELA